MLLKTFLAEFQIYPYITYMKSIECFTNVSPKIVPFCVIGNFTEGLFWEEIKGMQIS